MKPHDNSANIKNGNLGSPGTNRQYDKNQGNRGKQLNPTPNDANVRRTPAATSSAPSVARKKR
jgi:hypothetical protein